MPAEQVTKDTENLDLRQLLKILSAVKKGNFSVRMADEYTGMAGKVADAINDVIELNERMTKELERIGKVVGKEGKITQRASLGSAGGSWGSCLESINSLISDLVQPTVETSRVIRAVAHGDLSQTIPTEIEGRQLKGEFLQTAQVVNTMVEQLSSFASEVTRVAREVGTEGKLGVQAEVKGVAGTWKDLTDNVNLMAGNLTGQVRNIAEVATAIANGDLSKKITVDVKGEILELKNTVNTMVDQLNSFASEVTR
ncbi:HAMP domain-containing protein, partial [Trichocoleus sp. FACHB-262]|uniref:HAMP domain-containing protein n=1 Tax=Trichocoleus sp. FACHB-262 TaxID=2692869 RepID=UPI0016865889